MTATGRRRSWAGLGLAWLITVGLGCKELFGINEFAAEGGGAGAAGPTGSGAGGAGGAGGDAQVECMPGESKECYDGPPGTEDVGPCKKGTKVCNANGVGFGPCEGAVLPSAEDCGTPVHESCQEDISTFCGERIWSIQAGDGKNQRATGVAVNPTSVFVTGTFDGTVDLGCPGGAMASAGGLDAFVASFDLVDGHCVWAKKLGGSSDQVAQSVAIRGDALYVAGYSEGVDAIFDGSPSCQIASAGNKDIFLIKINPMDGSCLWSKRMGDSYEQSAAGLAVDSSGDAFLTGRFAGAVDAVDLCAKVGVSGSTNVDVFVAKINGNGQCAWMRELGDGAIQSGRDIAVESGVVTMIGDFQSTLTSPECGNVTNMGSPGTEDIFATQLTGDAAGSCKGSKAFGTSSYDSGDAVAMDAAGTVYLAGTMANTMTDAVDFVGCSLASDGYQIFLLRAGSTLLCAAKEDGVTTTGSGGRMVTDLALGSGPDQLFMTGHFNDSIDFGAGMLASEGGDDIFVTRWTTDLKPLWSKRFGGPGTQRATSVAVDADGNVLLAGYFSGSIKFDGAVVDAGPSAGGEDIFIAKLSP